MKNEIVKHTIFGEGKVVEVIDRSAPSILIDDKTGEVKTVKPNLPNLLVIEFEDGSKRKFQDLALKNPKFFIQKEEITE